MTTTPTTWKHSNYGLSSLKATIAHFNIIFVSRYEGQTAIYSSLCVYRLAHNFLTGVYSSSSSTSYEVIVKLEYSLHRVLYSGALVLVIGKLHHGSCPQQQYNKQAWTEVVICRHCGQVRKWVDNVSRALGLGIVYVYTHSLYFDDQAHTLWFTPHSNHHSSDLYTTVMNNK